MESASIALTFDLDEDWNELLYFEFEEIWQHADDGIWQAILAVAWSMNYWISLFEKIWERQPGGHLAEICPGWCRRKHFPLRSGQPRLKLEVRGWEWHHFLSKWDEFENYWDYPKYSSTSSTLTPSAFFKGMRIFPTSRNHFVGVCIEDFVCDVLEEMWEGKWTQENDLEEAYSLLVRTSVMLVEGTMNRRFSQHRSCPEARLETARGYAHMVELGKET